MSDAHNLSWLEGLRAKKLVLLQSLFLSCNHPSDILRLVGGLNVATTSECLRNFAGVVASWSKEENLMKISRDSDQNFGLIEL